VGGLAVGFHGQPRFTGDLDVFVDRSPENAARLLRALRAFGFPTGGLSEADFIEPEQVIQLGLSPRRIDILTSLSGVTFAEAWSSRVASELDGIPVNYIGKDALIRNKRALGRPRDLDDLLRLGAE
jgi:hypothetical protein